MATAFYQMAKHVYDVSQTLTPDQTAQGLFWRDVPGVTTAGHWLSILQQVLKQSNTFLTKNIEEHPFHLVNSSL